MTDGMGRTIDYIRISVTDRCNLRCRYCMPEEGVESIAHDRILRFGEILRIVSVLAGMGLKKVKITGGEPLVRRGVTDLRSPRTESFWRRCTTAWPTPGSTP